MSNTPSDAEILALAQEHLKAFAQFVGAGEVWFEGEVEFARAILAKWGAPQPVVREPMTDEWILSRCKESWVFETAKQWIRMVEAAHGIKAKEVGNA